MKMNKCHIFDFLSAAPPRVSLLICVWLMGMAMGVFLCQFFKDVVSTLMGSVLIGRTSIVALILSDLIPLLVSFLCHRYRFFLLVYLTAFAQAFILGFSTYAVALYCGGAGWLIHFFLLFHCYIGAACSYWLWLRQFSNHISVFSREYWICALLIGITGGLDYFLVSPFLETLWH